MVSIGTAADFVLNLVSPSISCLILHVLKGLELLALKGYDRVRVPHHLIRKDIKECEASWTLDRVEC